MAFTKATCESCSFKQRVQKLVKIFVTELKLKRQSYSFGEKMKAGLLRP